MAQMRGFARIEFKILASPDCSGNPIIVVRFFLPDSYNRLKRKAGILFAKIRKLFASKKIF
ncbi:hypothetical protein FPG3_04130 [Flavobacterium psychrophilum FPG3]|nr:hypothetical protein FPG3_04130 [Flavobacterium psychrophilum FPG3]OXB12094.1 hypothetical protein B0A57_06590 [Flavobacterium psychrophilum DSM 3660 = ATCC 49418]